jgi:phosphoribosylformylglycinamidine (FGAM) synthase-like enzyme
VIGCVGLVRDVTRIPSQWRAGDTVYLLLGEGPELVRFVWQNAHRFSLAHDISDGGLELALREASAWSGIEFSAAGNGEGVVVAATEAPDWPDTLELGRI